MDDLTKDWEGATIAIADGAGVSLRPAAFVFGLPGGAGMAWVEPSYADPAGPGSPALHIVTGTVTGTTVEAAGRSVEATPYEARDAASVGPSIDWFRAWLKARGSTWAAERERVREMIAADLDPA